MTKKKVIASTRPQCWALFFPCHLAFFFVKYSWGIFRANPLCLLSDKTKINQRQSLQNLAFKGTDFWAISIPLPTHVRWSVSPDAPTLWLGSSSWARRDVHCCLLIFQPFGVPRCFNYRGKGADDSGHMSPFHTNKSPRHPMQLCGTATVPLKLMLSGLITILNPSVSMLIQGTPAVAALPGKYSI